MTDESVRAGRVDLRTDRPTPARMYDYFLGGKDNFAVDRVAGDEVIETLGETLTYAVVWENRHFLRRVVRYLATECGIDQFIDIGAGLPTAENTHQIAQACNPAAKVVYVDNDPIVLIHGRALLANNPRTTVITADMRDPRGILDHPNLLRMIDLSRPVAVLLVAVLHFVPDADGPERIVSAFRDSLAPGSCVAISHLTSEGPPADEVLKVEDVYADATSPIVFRSGRQIAGFFDGLDMLTPGLVRPWAWHQDERVSERTNWLYAGVGRLPDQSDGTETATQRLLWLVCDDEGRERHAQQQGSPGELRAWVEREIGGAFTVSELAAVDYQRLYGLLR